MGDIEVCSPGIPADRPLHTVPCPLPPRVLRSNHSPPKKKTGSHVFFCPYTCSPQPAAHPHHLPLALSTVYVTLSLVGHTGLVICPPAYSPALGVSSLHLQAHRAMIFGIGSAVGVSWGSMPQSSPQWYNEFISCLEGSQVGARTQETFGY